MQHEEEAFSIWFLIGLLVGFYGILIFGAGIWEIVSPPAVPRVLANLHAAVWWGLLLMIFGACYAYFFRPHGRGR